jgi:hypothetical protein
VKLVLSFVHPSKPAKTVGPFKAIRIDAEVIRDHKESTLIAMHREHQWDVQGERYFRLDCTTRVRIHFERLPGARSRSFGPYRSFSAIDGITYADNRVFAFIDQKAGDWFCYDDGKHWPLMIVSDDMADGVKDPLSMFAGLAPLLGGVYALWAADKLLYLGRANGGKETLNSALTRFALESTAIDPGRISAVAWETASNRTIYRQPFTRVADGLT